MEIKIELNESEVKRCLCKSEHTYFDSKVECNCGYCEGSSSCCHCELCGDCDSILNKVKLAVKGD